MHSPNCSVQRWGRLKRSAIMSTWHIWKWITETQVHFSLAHPAVIQDKPPCTVKTILEFNQLNPRLTGSQKGGLFSSLKPPRKNVLRIYNVTDADVVKTPQNTVSFFTDAESHLQHAVIQLLPPALTSSPWLEGSMSPFPQSLARIDVLCHGISITQITRLFYFILL